MAALSEWQLDQYELYAFRFRTNQDLFNCVRIYFLLDLAVIKFFIESDGSSELNYWVKCRERGIGALASGFQLLPLHLINQVYQGR
jgi:hypothetical protein